MKTEIKEILQLIGDCCYYGKISEDKCKKYCNYITNLQEEKENQAHTIKTLLEENNILKEKIEHLLIDLDGESEYKQINEKAIEFVKKESKKCYTNKTSENPLKVIGNFMWHTDELLNILEGDKDE